MKILHLCLAALYVDNNSYQENILPRMHNRMGHTVKIVASTETYLANRHLGYVKPCDYVNEDGIPVKRIPYCKWFPAPLVHKLRIYESVYASICDFSPDLIFIHNCQFLSVISVKKYFSKHPNVKVVVDGHSDFFNSAKTFFSYRVLHRIIYRMCARIIEPCTSVFFGTLPARVNFFVDVYDLPKKKVALLPMGADDDVLQMVNNNQAIQSIRSKFAISEDDFLIVTGGKLNDNRPEMLSLFEAVSAIDNDRLKLIFFGSVSEKYVEKFKALTKAKRIIDVGWRSSNESCGLMAAADLVVFPGLHSVMWEQAVALGKPCIFRKLEGFDHVDIGGNAIFLDDVSSASLKQVIESVSDKNCQKYQNLLRAANDRKKENFLYSKIAEQSINV